ncbi:MAG: TetR/AcrR family transcriptional regulator [Clostridia bacterium]|nr:TetR/AcrR family transcriptional regulator [Clostridia bacterium]
MPPKAKFEREEIIAAALQIVKEQGMSALTARSLGAKLGSSPRPIFTVFQSMEEVQGEVISKAKAVYAEYVRKGLDCVPAFKGVGTQYILFAIYEPKLFQLLFMSEQKSVLSLSNVLLVIEEHYEDILASIYNSYSIETEKAERIYHHLWIYTHGIATLCATKTCAFTAEEISALMTDVFISLLSKIRGAKND